MLGHARRRARIVVVARAASSWRRRARPKVPVIPLPGGFQPRAAVGYATVVALEVAALCGATPSLRDEVEAAAALLPSLVEELPEDEPRRSPRRCKDACRSSSARA